MLSEIVVGDSIATAIYAKKAAQPNDLTFIVLPGNPGIIDFYIPFIDGLFDRLQRKYDVIGSTAHCHMLIMPL